MQRLNNEFIPQEVTWNVTTAGGFEPDLRCGWMCLRRTLRLALRRTSTASANLHQGVEVPKNMTLLSLRKCGNVPGRQTALHSVWHKCSHKRHAWAPLQHPPHVDRSVCCFADNGMLQIPEQLHGSVACFDLQVFNLLNWIITSWAMLLNWLGYQMRPAAGTMSSPKSLHADMKREVDFAHNETCTSFWILPSYLALLSIQCFSSRRQCHLG